MKLSIRAVHLVEELRRNGVSVRIPKAVAQYLADVKTTNKEIQFLTGKKNSNKKRAKLYRRLYRLANKLLKELNVLYERLTGKTRKLDIIPSAKQVVDRLIDWVHVDIQNLELTIHNSKRRINKGEKVPAEEKFYSLADEDAAMIVKGGREPTLGYRPQLGRSAGGLVTALIVPEGNAADSGQVEPIVEASMARTAVWPEILSLTMAIQTARPESIINRWTSKSASVVQKERESLQLSIIKASNTHRRETIVPPWNPSCSR
jgi:hypothetical protein